jgi:hypothetical protein
MRIGVENVSRRFMGFMRTGRRFGMICDMAQIYGGHGVVQEF